MSVLKPDRRAERGPDGRWLPGVVRKGALPWKQGISPNPGGKGGLYHEMQRLAREFTPQATRYLIEIAQDGGEDTRNRIVAMSMLYERAWGKPKEFDPNSQEKPPLDLSKLSPEALAALRQILAPVIGEQAPNELTRRSIAMPALAPQPTFGRTIRRSVQGRKEVRR